MLLDDEREPFATSNLFENLVPIILDELAHFLSLFVKNAGQNREAMELKNAIELREQIDDDVCSQVAKKQADRVAFDRIQRTAERCHVVLGIALDVRARDLRGNGVDVAGKDFLRAK